MVTTDLEENETMELNFKEQAIKFQGLYVKEKFGIRPMNVQLQSLNIGSLLLSEITVDPTPNQGLT